LLAKLYASGENGFEMMKSTPWVNIDQVVIRTNLIELLKN
jgi:hypothetical protein